jgi:hypothetical protein
VAFRIKEADRYRSGGELILLGISRALLSSLLLLVSTSDYGKAA